MPSEKIGTDVLSSGVSTSSMSEKKRKQLEEKMKKELEKKKEEVKKDEEDIEKLDKADTPGETPHELKLGEEKETDELIEDDEDKDVHVDEHFRSKPKNKER
jgi:hypothetical protein